MVNQIKDRQTDSIIVRLKNVVINNCSRGWCRLPYPGHPRGCPNYGKREICPPKAPLFEKIVNPPFVLVAVKFDLAKHERWMKRKHPNWSTKQARCLLYWQGKMDKRLRILSEAVASTIPNPVILYKPEANGVNVFETSRKLGLTLEKNPKKIVWKIAIIGIKNV